MGIVKRVDKGQAALFLNASGGLKAFGEHIPGQDNFRPVGSRMMDLGKGRVFGHDDGCRNAKPLGVIGNTLGMVSGRNGDNAAFTFFGRQAGKFDIGATFLERGGILLVFKFKINFCLANA